MNTMRRFHWLAAAMLASLLTAHSTNAQGLCASDCNGDGLVGVDEVIRTVSLALGTVTYRFCPPADSNTDNEVTVDDIVQGVNSVLVGCPETVSLYRAPEQTLPAGPIAGSNGRGITPIGRRIEPPGPTIPTETLPLNLALTPDERHLLITNDGYSDNSQKLYLQVMDTQNRTLTKTAVPQFFGLAMTANGQRVFVSSDVDGRPDRVDALQLADGRLTREANAIATLPNETYPAGLALGPDESHLFLVGLRSNTFYSINLADGSTHVADKNVGNLPFAVVLSKDGQRAYVTSWGINNGNPATGLVPAPLPPVDPNRAESSSVAEIDISAPDAPRVVRHLRLGRRNYRLNNTTVSGGTHPTAMALSPDGKLLYITITNVDAISVVDTTTMTEIAEVDLNVFADGAPDQKLQGLHPNALAVRADGKRLYVADAGINAVQVIDVDPQARTFTPKGFIPTGWYPTALALTQDGQRLYVANGKGAGVGPNGGAGVSLESDYIGRLMKGSISIIDAVEQYDLAAGTEQVVANNGLAPVTVRWVDGEPGDNEVQRGHPVPIEYGSGPSDQIKYVVLIFKENRTYDQVLGDLPGGNGDPSLAEYSGAVTPNYQALARQFAVGDNFHNDGEVSTLGHMWQDQGNCTDFTEKLWPGNYDRTLPSSMIEQSQEGFTKGGFTFQALERQRIPYRVYGETLALLSRFASGIDGGGVGSLALTVTQAFPGRLPTVDEIYTIVNGDIDSLRDIGVNVDILKQQVWPNQMLEFPMNILAHRTDKERAQLFKRELDQFVQRGELPNFLHIWLPNNHTFGGGAGAPTPRSAIADNDEGLGLVVEALSQTPFWRNMAIFVTEDDPQGGVDHVAATRTLSLVISPYAKRGYISSHHHSSMGMSKTMWLLLGAKPMSMFDQHATAMRDYFTTEPDYRPYTALPREIAPEVNPSAASAPNLYLRRAAKLSSKLDLASFDLDGEEMIEILDLANLGYHAEVMKSRMVAATCAFLLLLIAAGATVGASRSRVRS